VEDVERNARLHDIHQRAIQAAQQVFADKLEAALSEGDPIIVDRVRPALQALHRKAKALLDKHGAVLTDERPAVLIAQPAAVRGAWTRFGDLTDGTALLNEVASGLAAATAGHDSAGDFAVYRDDPRDPRLWGAGYGARRHATERPWPTEPRAYLAWLLTSDLDLCGADRS
jgi:hypothetical protein